MSSASRRSEEEEKTARKGKSCCILLSWMDTAGIERPKEQASSCTCRSLSLSRSHLLARFPRSLPLVLLPLLLFLPSFAPLLPRLVT